MPTELGIAVPITFTRNGAEATRRWKDYYDNAVTNAPKPGDTLPGYPLLTVDTTTITPMGVADLGSGKDVWAEVEVKYSLEYRKPKVGDAPRVSIDFNSEVLNVAAGRTWVADDDTTPDRTIDAEELTAATVFPLLSVSCEYAVANVPIEDVSSLQGKVNDDDFEIPNAFGGVTFGKGTVLIESASSTAQFDYDAQAWYYRMSYKFLVRGQGHNRLWRPKERQWDSTKGEWKRDSNTGEYLYTGVGGYWALTDPLLYQEADFSIIFGS